jgi:hypothetical protein
VARRRIKLSYHKRREFGNIDEIRRLGFSNIFAIQKTLFLETTGENSLIQCAFYKDDIHKLLKELKNHSDSKAGSRRKL